MPSPFKSVEVDLAKLKGWNWNYPDQQDRIADLTKDTLEDLDASTIVWFVRSLIGALDVRTRRGPKEWSPRGIVTEHDIRAMANDVTDADSKLPKTAELLHEVVNVMVEAAAMPNRSDFTQAMGETRDALEYLYRIDLELWAPILDGYYKNEVWTPEHVARALGNSVYFRSASTEYNHVLLFALGNSYPVGRIFRAARLPKEEFVERMNEEFERYRKAYLATFLRKLDEIMTDTNAKSRMDLDAAWAWVINREDKAKVRHEVREWFKP